MNFESNRAEEQSSKEVTEIQDARHSKYTVNQRFDHEPENQQGMCNAVVTRFNETILVELTNHYWSWTHGIRKTRKLTMKSSKRQGKIETRRGPRHNRRKRSLW